MSASLYFATKKAKNRTCNTMENGVAILWKNVLQLSPKSTCKKHTKNECEDEREDIKTYGFHMVFAYNIANEEYSELGIGRFSIEEGVLWRVG